MPTNPPINLIANPDLAPETVITYPGVVLGRDGRDAAIDGDCIVFDGTAHAPFVTFLLASALTAGDTCRINLETLELTGTLHVTTAGDDPVNVATITTAGGETAPEGFTFVATGTESGFTVTGDLHGCVARFRAPMLSE